MKFEKFIRYFMKRPWRITVVVFSLFLLAGILDQKGSNIVCGISVVGSAAIIFMHIGGYFNYLKRTYRK